jgi:tetratricopeptide (TPR) repeat protein
VLNALAALSTLAGRHDVAREHITRARAMFRELGLAVHAEASAMTAGHIERHAGDLEAADAVLSRGCDALAAIGDTVVLCTALGLLAVNALDLGRVDEAIELSSRSRELASPFTPEVYWRIARARALARLGEGEEAAALAREAVSAGDPTDLHTQGDAYAAVADVLHLAGENEDALAAARTSLDRYEQKGCIPCAERMRHEVELLAAAPRRSAQPAG